MNKLHLMTQDDQPLGSERKCCERCGVAYWHWDEDDAFVNCESDYTKEIADENNYTLCKGW